jgi:O-antigen/teichoic acid export membrane protein
MKRPEREPDSIPSPPAGLGSPDQVRQWGEWRAMQGGLGERDVDEPEELVSANPLEWWADAEAHDDARFATGPLISLDPTATGPLISLDPTATGQLPTIFQDMTAPAQQRHALSGYPLPPAIEGKQPRPEPPDEAAQAWTVERSPSGRPPHLTPYPPMPDSAPPQPRMSPTAPPRPATPSRPTTPPAVSYPSSSSAAPLDREITSYVPAWRVSTARMPAIAARAETVVVIVRRLMKSSGLYAVAALGAPAVSLALTPFLAHNMPVSEYGLLAVLNTSISLFAGLTQLGLGPAFFRAYNYDFTTAAERRSVLATSSLLMMAISVAFLLVSIPLAPSVATLLLRDRGGAGASVQLDVVIACLVIAVQNLSVPGFAWLRAENRALAFSMVSMLNVLVTLGASIIIVGVLRGGVAGAMIANGAGYAAAVAGTLLPMLVRSRMRFSLRVARSMFAFGAPLTLSVISVWVLQLSDRYLLAFFGDYGQTASYSVAYSLGSVLSTIVLSPFSLAWPTAMYSIAKRADAPRVFQQVFRWFTAVLLFAAFGLSLATTVLLNLLFPPSYRAAAPVIPIVAASIALYGTYTVVMVGANVKRKTWLTSVFTAVAALVNVGLNLILIPQFGAMGAAASTFFAYLALVIVAYFANQRIYPVPFEVTRAAFAGLMGIAMYYLIAELPDVMHQQVATLVAMLGPSLASGRSETLVTLALSVLGLLVYGIWLYMLLQIRTISFQVNPAIMRRLARRDKQRLTRRDLAEEAYVRR